MIIGNVLLKDAYKQQLCIIDKNSSFVFKTNRIWNRNRENFKTFC